MSLMHSQSRRFWYIHCKQPADMPLTAKLHADIARSIGAGDEAAAGKAMDKLLDTVAKFTRDTVTTDFWIRCLEYCRIPGADLRATRANRVIRADEKRIRAKNTVRENTKNSAGVMQDRRLRADVLFIRTQSLIRADGFSSAQ